MKRRQFDDVGQACPSRFEGGFQGLEGKVCLRLHALRRGRRAVNSDLTGNPDRVPHTRRLRKVVGVVDRLGGGGLMDCRLMFWELMARSPIIRAGGRWANGRDLPTSGPPSLR